MEIKDKKNSLKTELLRRLRDPFQLRMILTVLVVAIGYGAVYCPLSNDIVETQEELTAAQKRLAVTKEVETLRAQFKRCKPRLSEKPDTNEWTQYVMGEIRKLPVNLLNLDLRPVREVGPYKAIVLRIEVEGKFQDLHAFLCWLETNERFFRVDSIGITPPLKSKGNLVMELTVLGMMG